MATQEREKTNENNKPDDDLSKFREE